MGLVLSQRVALATGASSPLGLAIARTLAAEGCAVAMVTRRGELLEREAAEMVARRSCARCRAQATSRERRMWLASGHRRKRRSDRPSVALQVDGEQIAGLI